MILSATLSPSLDRVIDTRSGIESATATISSLKMYKDAFA